MATDRLSKAKRDEFYRTADRLIDEAVERIESMRMVGRNDEAYIAYGARRLSEAEVQAYEHAFDMAVMVVEFMRTPEFMR